MWIVSEIWYVLSPVGATKLSVSEVFLSNIFGCLHKKWYKLRKNWAGHYIMLLVCIKFVECMAIERATLVVIGKLRAFI